MGQSKSTDKDSDKSLLSDVTSEIRLVRILPAVTVPVNFLASELGDTPQPDVVSCQIEHFSLKDPQILTSKVPLKWEDTHDTASPVITPEWRYDWGDYVALSYTWGDPRHTRSVVINGHQIKVRSNLEEALRALRGKAPVRMGILIWIDALCINQDDIPERNEEVKRMRTIYSAARDVVVWLGAEENESAKAMRMIRTLAKSCDDGTDQDLGDELRGSQEFFGVGAWRAFGQLFNRPYWDRLWILQELAMGNSQTPILCGNEMVRWGDVYHATYTFGTRYTNLIFTYIEKECKDAGVPYSGLNRNKLIHLWDEQKVQAGRNPPQFMSMLDLGRKSQVTDLRDKVYGLMGLMPSEVATQIQPDYEQDLPEVYTSFAKALITATRSLEILEQCTSPSQHMPSWVPDWTNRKHFRLFSGRSTYHATVNKPPVCQFSAADTELSVQGFKIGEIDGLGASYYESYQSTKLEDSLVQSTSSNNAYGSDESIRNALWRMLIGNRTPNGKLAPDTYQCLLQCPLDLEDEDHVAGAWRGRKAFNHLLAQNKGLKLAGKTLGSFFPAAGMADPEASRDALERIFRFHRSRRLAVSVQGHFGLVPIATRKGDLVFLLLGCNVPMVLRIIEGNKFQVIGGCYLQGFMEGEAKEELDKEYGKVILC